MVPSIDSDIFGACINSLQTCDRYRPGYDKHTSFLSLLYDALFLPFVSLYSVVILIQHFLTSIADRYARTHAHRSRRSEPWSDMSKKWAARPAPAASCCCRSIRRCCGRARGGDGGGGGTGGCGEQPGDAP